jgi:alpha/beta superfamily hydrolase
MDTRDFSACVRVQADTLTRFRPDVLVGSSFGGAVAVEMLQRGLWQGPTLLLAQAAVKRGQPPYLPEGVRVWLVHGRADQLVEIQGSRELARTGTPELVRLIEVDDDHSLHGMVQSGELVVVVGELVAAADTG